MYRVLLPVDTNVGRALHQAKYVGRLATVADELAATVLHVAPEWMNRHFSQVEAASDAAEYLEEQGVDVTRVVAEGHVSRQIVDHASERDCHEIVIGGRKRSGVTMVVLGSIVQDVLLSADRPVTVTGKSRVSTADTYRILLPVDTSEERARDQAAYVAGLPNAADRAEVTVMYVQDSGALDKFSENDAAVAAADTLADAGISVDRVTAGGNVSPKIVSRAVNLGVDDIVMGGRKRSGIQKALLGSTTQDVILSDERPVTITGS
ncbi:MAG: universal stress protein [Haloferacaceae archaeon]